VNELLLSEAEEFHRKEAALSARKAVETAAAVRKQDAEKQLMATVTTRQAPSPSKKKHQCYPAPDVDFVNKVQLPLRLVCHQAKTDGTKTREGRIRTRAVQSIDTVEHWKPKIEPKTLVNFLCKPMTWWMVRGDIVDYPDVRRGLRTERGGVPEWEVVMPWHKGEEDGQDRAFVQYVNWAQPKAKGVKGSTRRPVLPHMDLKAWCGPTTT
jgi:hypothetical protein